jgi:hypothetical protein
MRDPRFGFAQVGTYPLRLLRDEEAAGSNPATPTKDFPGQRPLFFLSASRVARWCPILGAKWEPILVGGSC